MKYCLGNCGARVPRTMSTVAPEHKTLERAGWSFLTWLILLICTVFWWPSQWPELLVGAINLGATASSASLTWSHWACCFFGFLFFSLSSFSFSLLLSFSSLIHLSFVECVHVLWPCPWHRVGCSGGHRIPLVYFYLRLHWHGPHQNEGLQEGHCLEEPASWP